MSLEQVTLTQSLKGQTIQNVFHLTNPDGALTGQQIAALVLAEWITEIRKIQGGQLIYHQILVQRVDPAGQAATVTNISTPGAATGYDAFLPPLCVVMQKRTGFFGRHGRGRYYISGWNSGALHTTGTWDPGHLGDVMLTITNNLTAKWIDPGVSALRLVVAGRGPDNQWLSHSCTSLSMRPVPGYQRRRNIGIGI